MLAYYHYPFVPNRDIQEYTAEDLLDPQKVEELFDYCQILEADITKSGWRFLIDHYGYEALYEIDRKSGWSPEDTIEGFIEWVAYKMEIAGE